MRLWSDSWANGEAIPERCAAGKPGPGGPTFSDNCNPHLAWSDLPAGTKSLVLICHDFDVPSRGDDVNKEGRVVPASLPLRREVPVKLESRQGSEVIFDLGEPGVPLDAQHRRQGVRASRHRRCHQLQDLLAAGGRSAAVSHGRGVVVGSDRAHAHRAVADAQAVAARHVR